MSFHAVRIAGEPNSIHKHVYLDGQKLKGVKQAALIWSVDTVPTVYLELMALNIEVDDPEMNVVMSREGQTDGYPKNDGNHCGEGRDVSGGDNPVQHGSAVECEPVGRVEDAEAGPCGEGSQEGGRDAGAV